MASRHRSRRAETGLSVGIAEVEMASRGQVRVMSNGGKRRFGSSDSSENWEPESETGQSLGFGGGVMAYSFAGYSRDSVDPRSAS